MFNLCLDQLSKIILEREYFWGWVISLSIIDEAVRYSRSSKDTVEILTEFKEILIQEREKRRYPRGLVRLGEGSYFAVGDIHGDLETLERILSMYGLYDHLQNRGYVVFLGDYVDRGYAQLEVFLTIALLKKYFRDRVIVLRGNHEGPQHLLPYPHDYRDVLRYRFGSFGEEIYRLSREIFDLMPYAAYREKRVLFVHGGIPVFSTQNCPDNIECILDAEDPYGTILEEILWNDPLRGYEDIDYLPSPRGAGYLWGINITKEFLRKTGLRFIVRGHEPAASGYMLDHDNKVLTLFSRLGEPYFNAYAAIADLGNIDLFNEFRVDEMIILIEQR
ncbi:MAG: metallophosphoesterase family protein [Sulfolobales archaeon]